MITIAHIINPVRAAPGSDLFLAQPITFETMRRARKFSLDSQKKELEVSQFTAQYPQDRHLVPGDFIPTEDLERSVLDVGHFKVPRKLPLIRDILDRLFNCTTAKHRYLLYTNVDIGLQPHFYSTVSKIIEQGFDAFIINRRTIPAAYKEIDEIPLMYAQLGENHKGWDCFVFKRSLYPDFHLGTACIGSGWIGRVLITNLAALSQRFKIFTDLHLTFHIGNEKSWKSPDYRDYLAHNRNQCHKILMAFEQKFGRFDRDRVPGRFFQLLEKKTK